MASGLLEKSSKRGRVESRMVVTDMEEGEGAVGWELDAASLVD